MPDTQTPAVDVTGLPAAHRRLVDERLGVIRRLVDYPMPPWFPPALVTRGADVANSLDPQHWHADRAAIGASFHDPAGAGVAAIGEAVERYCGNYVPTGLLHGSYSSLTAQGHRVLDPESIVLFSAEQYATPGFPFVPFTRDLDVLWTVGRDLHDDGPCLLPASLVYCNVHVSPTRAAEPATNGLVYAGIAAGPDRWFAEASALEELVERDATALWWHSGAAPEGLDVDDDPRLVSALAVRDVPARVGYHFFTIPTRFDTAVVGCLLHDRTLDVVGAGFACRPDPGEAALKACAEAIGTWFYSTGILDPDGAIWQAIAAGALDPRAYKPYRADRRYLDDFRPDYRDVIDLGAQMQYHLDPRTRPLVARIIQTPRRRSLPAPTPAAVGQDPAVRRSRLLADLAHHQMRAYAVDVTTPDIAGVGLHVARVITPDLTTNAPAAAPYLGGDRIRTEAHRLGLVDGPLREDDLVRAPMPHV